MGFTLSPPESQRSVLWRQMIAEMVGTYFLTFFGTGSVAAAVLTGQFSGLYGVVSVWGFGATLAIFASCGISGAHLNPAVSFALLLNRPKEMPVWKFFPFIFAQLVGGIFAGLTVLATYSGAIGRFEANNGGAHSIKSGMMFGMYFPNPNVNDATGSPYWHPGDITQLGAFGVEAFGTLVLVFLILALTDSNNKGRPGLGMAPFFIGFSISCLMALYAPLTQSGLNPARDFGPRLVACLAGWWSLAIPGPGGGFWVYIAGPMFGGPLGAFLYNLILGHNFTKIAEEDAEKAKRIAAFTTKIKAVATFSEDNLKVLEDRFSVVKEELQLSVFNAVQRVQAKNVSEAKDITYDDMFN